MPGPTPLSKASAATTIARASRAVDPSTPSGGRRWTAVLAALAVAGLAAFAFPAGANHPQTVTANGSTYTVEFDHDGDNEWWVEVQARASNGDSVVGMWAQVEGETGRHAMQAQSNTWERQQQGWQKYASAYSYDPVHVPAGKMVRFTAQVLDGPTGNVADVTSCWFTHPAGVEQCGSASTSTSATSTTGTGGFDATFTGVRGNEWWAEARVASNGPAIAKVDLREHLDGGWSAFQPLQKQSWAATAWGASYHVPQGTIVQLRATAGDGRADLSSCRQWIPASGQEAQIVACPGSATTTTTASSTSTSGPGAFDATFSGVKGNTWWVQANVAANQALAGVDVRVDCDFVWRPLAKQEWGGWAASFNIPNGAKVDFRARSTSGADDVSGGYVWTAASPTGGCPQGGWPREGSFATYRFSSGVCGGGECFNSQAVLDLVHRTGRWTGTCTGEDRHTLPDGTSQTTSFTSRHDGLAPFRQRPDTHIGAQVQQKDAETRYGSGSCSVASGPTLAVDHQETYQTGLQDARGHWQSDRVWVAIRDIEPDNKHDSRWDTDLGMVLQSADYPRRSAQGSNWMTLSDTDAPLTLTIETSTVA